MQKPDEETGGADGMGQLLAAPEVLQTLQPIGFALDEGLANPRRAFTLFYGERTPWWLLIRAQGPTVRVIEPPAPAGSATVTSAALCLRTLSCAPIRCTSAVYDTFTFLCDKFFYFEKLTSGPRQPVHSEHSGGEVDGGGQQSGGVPANARGEPGLGLRRRMQARSSTCLHTENHVCFSYDSARDTACSF